MGARILQFARTRYAGFNDRYLCEKLGGSLTRDDQASGARSVRIQTIR
jgi:hypothetical protein